MGEEDKTQDRAGGVNFTGGQTEIHGHVVGRDMIVRQAPVPAVVALHQLPPPPADFTGREREIRELMEAVGTAGVTVSGLQGLGGVGKTALALKLAEHLKLRYPDAQFCLDLKGVSKEPLTPKAAMEHIIRAYHPDAKLPESEAELGGLYRSVLHEKKALLLMDNARDAKQVEALIPPPSCMLLVTSRQHFTLPGLVPKNLDALSPPDARELLLLIAPRLAQEKKDYTSDLARLCGYLPLALRSVASALAARINLSPADYAQKLADAQERLKLTEVDASLQLSYDLLTPNLQKRFRALAVFPDSFDAAGVTAVWEKEARIAEEALGELLIYSLLEFNPASARYRLHDLVRVFADAKIDGAERMSAQLRHARHYKDVLAAADDLYFGGGDSVKKGLELFDLEWGNIQAGQRWAAAHAHEHDLIGQLSSYYSSEGLFCRKLRLHPREQIRWFEAGLIVARQLKNREAEGSLLSNIGLAYYFLGELARAIEYHKQHLQIAREFGNLAAEGHALGNLGHCCRSTGQYRRAIEYYEQNLRIAREARSRRDEAHSLGNLGVVYKELGEFEHAIEYYQESLQVEREVGDLESEGVVLGNLGVAYKHLGDHERAIESHEKSLQIARQIHDRRSEGMALANLGNLYASRDQCQRAIEYCEEALQIMLEIGDQRGEGQVLGNLGVAYLTMGEYHRSIESSQQQLQIARRIGDKPGEGIGLLNIAVAFDGLTNRSKAIEYAEAALNILEQIESPYSERVRKQLAKWRGTA